MPTRRKLAERRVRLRMLTAGYRSYPGFLVLGAQRSGTSSLYRYLGAHPDLIPSIRKETQYFSTRYHEGDRWYRAHFPLVARERLQSAARGVEPLAFEATPDYLFHPAASWRVRQSPVSDARFIVMLRDPVERAFSHYRHMVRLGIETMDFDEAVEREADRIGPDFEAVARNPYHGFVSALRFSYVRRGEYVEQLERWFALFPADQFLVLDFTEFMQDPATTLEEICRHLDVRPWSPDNFPNYSVRRESATRAEPGAMSAQAAALLSANFASKNQDLRDLTGRDFPWL